MISPKKMALPISDPPPRAIGDDTTVGVKVMGSTMTKRGAYAAISYMTCSVLLILFNKAALSSYNFPSAKVITLLQMVCSNCILYVMKRWKLISFNGGESWGMSDSVALVPFRIFLHTLPLSFSYLLYMVVSIESVRGVSVPMYTTLRRTTVVFTMIVEYILVGERYTYSMVGSIGLIVFGAFIVGAHDPSFDTYGYTMVFMANITTAVCLATISRDSTSVGLIVFGAFIAGAHDLSFDTYGYTMVFMANITTAVYLATISRVGKTSGLNIFGLMWCNGLICAPILLLWTLLGGDLQLFINFPFLSSLGFQAVMLLSCIMAFFLNYSIFLNTTLNSAVMQTICGNLKDFFTVGLGWVLFGGLPFDLLNVIGQGLGFLGSGFYAYVKLQRK